MANKDIAIYGKYVISETPAYKIHKGRGSSRYLHVRDFETGKMAKRKVCYKDGSDEFYFRALLKMKDLIDNNKIQDDGNNNSTT